MLSETGHVDRSWYGRDRLGTEAREAATERVVLVALVVSAAQATRFRYVGGWLGRLLGAFME